MDAAWNLEWLNQNANRAYPFSGDTSRRDVNNMVSIPDSMIVDLILVFAADVSAELHLSKLIIGGNTLTAVISDDTGVIVCSVTINKDTHVQNSGYNLVGSDDHFDARGRIVFGDLSGLSESIPDGAYEFTSAAARFEARTARPDLGGVRAIELVRADGTTSLPISGLIELIAGTNVRLSYVAPVGGNPAGIRIDAISGENLDEECDCEKLHVPPEPIRTINGIAADSNGDFAFESLDGCLEITPGDNGLQFSDTCAKPCCGCVELEFITQHLGLVDSTIATLNNRVDMTDQNLDNFINSVLGSI